MNPFASLVAALKVELGLAREAAKIAKKSDGWRKLSVGDIERLARWVR